MLLLLSLLATASAADWSLADQPVAWPLCGRIMEAPPAGWVPQDGCPAARTGALHDDLPIDSTYGPRVGTVGGPRFDWHRGIDLHTPCGTPVFAAASGRVTVAGDHNVYGDGIVRIRHGDAATCEGGCWHTEYVHLSGTEVRRGEEVRIGDLIGYTGYTDAGWQRGQNVAAVCAVPHDGLEHLHFEVREAPTDQPFSTWAQDAVHPLRVLPLRKAPMNRYTGAIAHVDTSAPGHPVVTVHVEAPTSGPLDLNGIFVQIWRRQGSGFVRVPQPTGAPDPLGWVTTPPWIDFEVYNRMWTHKNASYAPWSSWWDCPYVDDHTKHYDVNLHLERPWALDPLVGDFNGIRLDPAPRVSTPGVWKLDTTFSGLVGPTDPNDLCVVAYLGTISGQTSSPATWGCR